MLTRSPGLSSRGTTLGGLRPIRCPHPAQQVARNAPHLPRRYSTPFLLPLQALLPTTTRPTLAARSVRQSARSVRQSVCSSNPHNFHFRFHAPRAPQTAGLPGASSSLNASSRPKATVARQRAASLAMPARGVTSSARRGVRRTGGRAPRASAPSSVPLHEQSNSIIFSCQRPSVARLGRGMQ